MQLDWHLTRMRLRAFKKINFKSFICYLKSRTKTIFKCSALRSKHKLPTWLKKCEQDKKKKKQGACVASSCNWKWPCRSCYQKHLAEQWTAQGDFVHALCKRGSSMATSTTHREDWSFICLSSRDCHHIALCDLYWSI